MRTLTRVTLTATFLYGGLALGLWAVSEKLYPPDATIKGDRLDRPN